MSDTRDDEVHAFDQTNGVAEGLDGRTVNAVDFPDENAASASTLAGSGVEDSGVQADAATEDAPDLDARAARDGGDGVDTATAPMDSPESSTDDGASSGAGLGEDDETVAAVAVSEDSDAPATAGTTEDGVKRDDAVDDALDAADPQGAPTDDDGVETPAQERRTVDRDEHEHEHHDHGAHHHEHGSHLPVADPLAGDPGHVFDQTNGVIDGIDGESDGTAASDAASAAER